MTILRVKRKRNRFAQIDVTPLRDRTLSFKARGIMAFLMTKPDNWTIREANLVDESDQDGLTAIRSGLKELKVAGYIAKIAIRDPETHRIVKWETLIFETPEDRQDWITENPQYADQLANLINSPHLSENLTSGPDVEDSTFEESQIPGFRDSGKSDPIYINDLPYQEESITDFSYEAEPGENQTESDPDPGIPESSPSLTCQSEASTETVTQASNSLEKQEYSAAAPRRQNPNEAFMRPANIPIWRTGNGPNQWNEQLLSWWVKWLDKKFPGEMHSRADAIAFIAKREHGPQGDQETLAARVQEVMEFGRHIDQVQVERQQVEQQRKKVEPVDPQSRLEGIRRMQQAYKSNLGEQTA